MGLGSRENDAALICASGSPPVSPLSVIVLQTTAVKESSSRCRLPSWRSRGHPVGTAAGGSAPKLAFRLESCVQTDRRPEGFRSSAAASSPPRLRVRSVFNSWLFFACQADSHEPNGSPGARQRRRKNRRSPKAGLKASPMSHADPSRLSSQPDGSAIHHQRTREPA